MPNAHNARWMPGLLAVVVLFSTGCGILATPTPTPTPKLPAIPTLAPGPASTTVAPVATPTTQPKVTPTATATPTFTPSPIATATTTPTPTATTPAPTATKGPLDLPDLVIVGMGITTEKAGCVLSLPIALGVSLTIGNTGTADAGLFVVDVNGVRQTVASGLPRGKSITLWFSGYQYGGESTAVVDVTSQVEESNEENNRRSQILPLPTPPPICTPTPTRTPTPTFTPAPTPTTQPVIIAPPAPTPTPTPTPVPLFLTVLQPADGIVVETSTITILGKTLASALVSINGDVVDVDAAGNFSWQVNLDVGPNVFEAFATDEGGNEATAQFTVHRAS